MDDNITANDPSILCVVYDGGGDAISMDVSRCDGRRRRKSKRDRERERERWMRGRGSATCDVLCVRVEGGVRSKHWWTRCVEGDVLSATSTPRKRRTDRTAAAAAAGAVIRDWLPPWQLAACWPSVCYSDTLIQQLARWISHGFTGRRHNNWTCGTAGPARAIGQLCQMLVTRVCRSGR